VPEYIVVFLGRACTLQDAKVVTEAHCVLQETKVAFALLLCVLYS
jgi:hypothetical protein